MNAATDIYGTYTPTLGGGWSPKTAIPDYLEALAGNLYGFTNAQQQGIDTRTGRTSDGTQAPAKTTPEEVAARYGLTAEQVANAQYAFDPANKSFIGMDGQLVTADTKIWNPDKSGYYTYNPTTFAQESIDTYATSPYDPEMGIAHTDTYLNNSNARLVDPTDMFVANYGDDAYIPTYARGENWTFNPSTPGAVDLGFGTALQYAGLLPKNDWDGTLGKGGVSALKGILPVVTGVVGSIAGGAMSAASGAANAATTQPASLSSMATNYLSDLTGATGLAKDAIGAGVNWAGGQLQNLATGGKFDPTSLIGAGLGMFTPELSASLKELGVTNDTINGVLTKGISSGAIGAAKAAVNGGDITQSAATGFLKTALTGGITAAIKEGGNLATELMNAYQSGDPDAITALGDQYGDIADKLAYSQWDQVLASDPTFAQDLIAVYNSNDEDAIDALNEIYGTDIEIDDLGTVAGYIGYLANNNPDVLLGDFTDMGDQVASGLVTPDGTIAKTPDSKIAATASNLLTKYLLGDSTTGSIGTTGQPINSLSSTALRQFQRYEPPTQKLYNNPAAEVGGNLTPYVTGQYNPYKPLNVLSQKRV